MPTTPHRNSPLADATSNARLAALGGRRHRLSLLVLLAVVVGLACLAIVSTSGVSAATAQASDSAAVADLYRDARFSAMRALDSFDQYQLHNDERAADAADAAISNLLHRFDSLARIPSETVAITDLKHKSSQIVSIAGRSDTLRAAGREAAAERADRHADEAAAAAIADLSRLATSAEQRSQDQLADAQWHARRVGFATPIVLAGVLLLALWVCAVLVRDRRRVRDLATTDALTDLPNRLGLADVVNRALRDDDGGVPPKRCALLLLDLDRFKEINDGLGHEYGDELLRAVARRLRNSVSATDTVARIGGDEFVVVLSPADAADAEAAAIRMRAALREPFAIDGVELSLDVSIGIAVAGPGTDIRTAPSALLRAADLAMYAAKELGGGHVRYTPELGARVAERVMIVGQVRRALDLDELVLHYQPQVSLDDHALVGVEALLRWEHPVRGLVAPGEFLPVVEDHQLIDRITNVVLNKAIRQVKAWQDEGMRIPISVNVATRSLLNANFPQDVADLLAQYGVDASLLCIEITETTVMRDSARCARTLQSLHDLGVRLSVDDYGTGYASMVYLKDVPLDELKIDRSFVSRMTTEEQQRVLTHSVIELGHNLGLSVVAEGVEDPEVREALRASGCDVAQGFLYSEPVPAAEIAAWHDNGAGFDATSIVIPAQRTSVEGAELA